MSSCGDIQIHICACDFSKPVTIYNLNTMPVIKLVVTGAYHSIPMVVFLVRIPFRFTRQRHVRYVRMVCRKRNMCSATIEKPEHIIYIYESKFKEFCIYIGNGFIFQLSVVRYFILHYTFSKYVLNNHN